MTLLVACKGFACVQDFIETVKVVLAPGGVMLFAHQIRRAVSFYITLSPEASLRPGIPVCTCTALSCAVVATQQIPSHLVMPQSSV